MRSNIAGALFALLLMLGSGTAGATSALILNPNFDGPILPAEQTGMLTAVTEALKAEQFEVIPPSELESTMAAEPQLRDCFTALCFEQFGRLLASSIVLRYRVKVNQPAGEKTAAYRLNVELLDVDVGAMGARLTEECPHCSTEQATEQLADMVKRAVFQSAALPRGVLEVHSTPTGAAVFIDGTELGITPYKRSAFTGPHKLVLRHVGYRSQQLDAQVDEGQKKHVEVALHPGNDPVNIVVIEREKQPVYKKWWFWVAIGGAVAAAGAITAGIVVGTRSTPAGPMVPANTYMFTF
jgi:hypothetical protein